ncbi:hypothetical protein GLOIN_2v1507717 [Rhizophagus irregularis DAOM 181602=DAOM 197198]|uniref:Uncharacterized protein n=1 Tax=Rhizophagus irregularis (strain DAOM 181602 / DAOM 197198 / MUCL 43194) TaxID=747089 RepID=A0A2P4QUU6_RHIID|nr:hypothetical protein GLOIN_2v1507717 [Rhizophagus irregularis DAOM 181602=DAOM 197198]POG81416.1 hypothetical protein GLOIN_2v1507717 [Rhizophagus irregularis DAOM 181602=DAOM 197198]GET60512.1 hypothetical protein GLOIN_2v1507717 [Rhizophagus irregularis DAOM 181602=DAOM 197198]|eukprot:XP_025188282.1 hypothetical protein GLOIN_2v1507717 [Rhizophagus irregularis DAOM 181602=DAOM 197198]
MNFFFGKFVLRINCYKKNIYNSVNLNSPQKNIFFFFLKKKVVTYVRRLPDIIESFFFIGNALITFVLNILNYLNDQIII